MSEIPLSLYLHFPWCIKKCPYCDFNSHALRADLPEAEYLGALQRDLELELRQSGDREIQSVFFGGGTPSLMSASTVESIIEQLSDSGRLPADAEITLEANPGAADASRFRGYRSAGVNRLSIGVQSLNDRSLRQLGRIHDARQGRSAVDAARRAGFDNLNIDLMFGLPGQSLREGCADIDAVLKLAPSHISYYQLTIEPNTGFSHAPPELPDEELIERIHEYGLERLRESAFFRYEVSAFATSGHRCLHNLNYWSFGDYLGVGPGAHGKLTGEDGILRYAKPRHPKQYLACAESFRQNEKSIAKESLAFEFMLNALRLRDGFLTSDFESRTGLAAQVLEPVLSDMVEQRLLKHSAGRIRATDNGYLYLNDVIAQFLPDD